MFRSYWMANKFFFWLISIVLFASCTVVKNYPAGKPFVYKNTITVEGDADKDEKKRLQAELFGYLDDSLLAPTISQLGVRTVIKNPPAFDTAAITRSIIFMQSYLNSQGYYNPIIRDTSFIDSVKDQLRTTVAFNIDANRNLHLDSVSYDSLRGELKDLANANVKQSFLKKNTPYTKQLIASELDRLVLIYRKNGYFRISRENLFAEVDTSDVGLLQVTLDPFEQARIIAEATERRRERPTIDVAIKERLGTDSTAFDKHFVGKVYFYPETEINEIPDSVMKQDFPIVFTQREYTAKQRLALIHFRPLREHTFLREGRMYDEDSYFKTINQLSTLGAWNQVDVRTVVKQDSVPVIDFHIFLTPAP
ncbi:MAG: hypothetical protein JWQ96_1352, partial [Segetibacter sp.]|nr:hypothetical protein [Segetibacter sp.]